MIPFRRSSSLLKVRFKRLTLLHVYVTDLAVLFEELADVLFLVVEGVFGYEEF